MLRLTLLPVSLGRHGWQEQRHPTPGHFCWLYLGHREGNTGSEDREGDWGRAVEMETVLQRCKVTTHSVKSRGSPALKH